MAVRLELCCDNPKQASELLSLMPLSLLPQVLVSLKGYCSSSLVVVGELTDSQRLLLDYLHTRVVLSPQSEQ
jgi:hypothetical protein